ncbi:WD40 repeat-like protein [Gonapodya prolifera JEL478]|uniref:WD40 repeat-like protein n=1 Tax=Gonapodya prolifera (strain JEL478) TaxID=1344416 RepID=A0A139A2Q3_GONPJ|nr:WD40 repeat-like protein [Gonapodya prolifera JEL478]|eukprot:KXS11066.1 WD40 repeat-like protein [Gonapodya prolifera JEL478]
MDDSDSDDDNRKSSPKPTPADSHTAPLERTPVWQDPHDARLVVPIADIRRARKLRQNESEKAVDGIEYSRRLREQFERIYPRPTWAMSQPERAKLGLPTFPPPSTTRGPSASTAAAYDFDDGESAEGNIFSSSKSLIGERASRRVGALPPEILEVVRAKDGNQMQYSQTSLCSVSWHPTHPILLTASSSTPSLHLFHIDGKLNNKLQSLSFPDLHPTCARFSRDGREVLATGRRKYFYAFDVEAGKVERVAGIRGRDDDRLLDAFTVGGAEGEPMVAFLGKDGHVDLVDGRTKQWVGDLKMNGSVVAAEFSADGKRVFSIGGDGVVYVWDVGSRRCMHTFVDEGTIKPTTIAVSPNDQILATGNTMGIVNVYNLATAMSSQRPKPLKAVGNLTTSISALTFNATSEMLAISSRAKKDALRLLHVPTRTVFQNWPTAGTPLGHVTCHEFSPGGGYISIGNSKGKALLYRLGHYQSL